MSKRTELGEQARDLYVVHGMTLRAISQKLGVSERTLQTWKAEERWDEARASITGSEAGFHAELFDLGRVVARKIKDDLQNGKELDNRIYHLERIVSTAIKSREYEKDTAAGSEPVADAKSDSERRRKTIDEVRSVMGLHDE